MSTKLQLNTRVARPVKEAVERVAKEAEVSQETLVADAIRHFFGLENEGSAMRRQLCKKVFRDLHGDSKPFDKLAAA